MIDNELVNEYFNWLVDKVCYEQYPSKEDYSNLLGYLFCSPFEVLIKMDQNRVSDGLDMRMAFGYENKYLEDEIKECMGDMPCSVLEVMVALADRGEVEIMDDPAFGDRRGMWFWSMIDNLLLRHMANDNFKEIIVDNAVRRLNSRTYQPDGTGGLFIVKSRLLDMRDIEIWYQLNYYLEEVEY